MKFREGMDMAEKMDFAKVLAILAQPQEKPAPLTDTEIREIPIRFMD